MSAEEKLQEVRDQYLKDRQSWVSIIKGMASRMKEIHDIAELQVDLFSKRQIVVEYISSLRVKCSKVYQKYRKNKSNALDDFTKTSQIRYNKSDVTTILEGVTAVDREYIDILETQIYYYEQTVKTIDNMIYGVKHRIELENHRMMK